MRRHVSESAFSRLLLAASMAGAFAVAGCVGTPTSALERMGNAIDQGEMAIDDPHVLIDTLGPIDLEVDSFGGTVRIEAVPGMTGTVIEPVRRAFLGHLRRDEAEASTRSTTASNSARAISTARCSSSRPRPRIPSRTSRVSTS
jgi:HAMP domain-containing protein